MKSCYPKMKKAENKSLPEMTTVFMLLYSFQIILYTFTGFLLKWNQTMLAVLQLPVFIWYFINIFQEL